MKRSVLIFCYLLPALLCNATVITWDGGGGDGQWNTAANWTGDVVPGPADDVLLDNSSLAGNYTVTLPNTAVTIISLTITPSSGSISLLLPATNTITTDAFVTTGTGYTVTINNGGSFINNAGVSSGTNFTIADSFRINNGGEYIHRTRSGHAGWNIRLAKISGTETGSFVFDIPGGGSYTIATSLNRVFGRLQLSSTAAGGTQTYTSNAGGVLTVNSDFLVDGGVTYSYTPPAAGTTFLIKRDCYIFNGAVFNLALSGANDFTLQLQKELNLNGTITETGTSSNIIFELNGTINQLLKGTTGSITNQITLVMNNAAGATLLNPLTLPYNLQLTSGKITTTVTNLLTLSDDGQATGGSSTSFVNGPMKKTGDDDFIFPLGTGSIYAPLGISGGTGATITDEFTAEYIRASPQSTYGTNYAAGINHISYVEYWTLDRGVATTASKNVMLDVHATSFCKQVANTFVSKWDGTQWTNEPSSAVLTGTTGAYELGTVTTIAPITSFSPFTLATDQDFITNPLPVHLIDLTVVKMNSYTAAIRWKLATPCSGAVTFTVERAADRNNYSDVQTITGNDTWLEYTVTDNQLPKGTSYYRLRTKDEAGKITYSKIAALINDGEGLLLSAVLPNPVQGDARVTIITAKSGVVLLFLYDLSGKLVQQWQVPVSEGNNTVAVPSAMLSKGIYQLMALQGNSRSGTRLVKQ